MGGLWFSGKQSSCLAHRGEDTYYLALCMKVCQPQLYVLLSFWRRSFALVAQAGAQWCDLSSL